MDYTSDIRKSVQNFVSVLQKAKDWFTSLSKTEQQNLIDDLEHETAHLTNTRQLNAYIAKYGEIHQVKYTFYQFLLLKFRTQYACMGIFLTGVL